MSAITIDGVEYKLDELSEDAKAQITSLNFVDAEIARLQAEISVFQTARNAYALALSGFLPKK